MLYRKVYYFSQLLISIALIFNVFLSETARSEEADIPVWMDAASGFAIGGYDPVAYFTRRKAVKGRYEFQYDYKDVYWTFENSGNKVAFKRHPYVYRPQFSGYDPFALAKGRTIRGLPTLWVIHRNRLFFFHNIIHRRLWLDNQDKYLRKAIQAWPKLSRVLQRRIEID